MFLQGATIKRIMDETDTKIAVSSISEISNFNMERIITLKGEIDNMSKAEAEISSKLRAAYEADVQAMAVSVLYSRIVAMLLILHLIESHESSQMS